MATEKGDRKTILMIRSSCVWAHRGVRIAVGRPLTLGRAPAILSTRRKAAVRSWAPADLGVSSFCEFLRNLFLLLDFG